MSAWANQKRFQILLTIIVISVFVITGTFFFVSYDPPRCDDGILNGAEEGIDCGGICVQACPAPLSDLFTVWTRAFPIDAQAYSALAYVDNRNKEHYIPSIQYEFVFYDSNATAFNRFSGFTSVNPGGVTPIFIPHILSGERKVENILFRFVSNPLHQFVKADTKYPFIFGKTDIQIGENVKPRIITTVENTGETRVAEVDFVVILYDQNDTAVAASRTFERDMLPGEVRELLYTWVNPIVLPKVSCPGGLCENSISRTEIVPIVKRR